MKMMRCLSVMAMGGSAVCYLERGHKGEHKDQVACLFATEAQLAAAREALAEAERQVVANQEERVGLRAALTEAERLAEVRAISIRQHSDSLDTALAKLAQAEPLAMTLTDGWKNHRIVPEDDETYSLLVDNYQGDKGHPLLTSYMLPVLEAVLAFVQQHPQSAQE